MRPDRARRWAEGLAAAVLSVAVITAAVYGLREIVPVVSTGVVYLLAVLLVSSRFGGWFGLLTALLSAAAFNFFHLHPTGEFSIADGENWVALAVFLVTAAVTSTLAEQARSRAEEAERRRREADLAAEMASTLLSDETVERALPTVASRVARAVGLPSAAIELGWIDSDKRRRALPLIVDGNRFGTLLIPRDTPAEVVELLEARVVPSLETLIAAARRRGELEAQVVETKALRRSNVVKTALLRSVSHDLRTPLTAITTAAAGLSSDTLSERDRDELGAVIAEESKRLTGLVDDLLDLTRLQAGGMEPRSDWCSVEEIVSSAVNSVTAPAVGVDLQVDSELPLIRADAAQVERAIANVLENALRVTGSDPVAIRVRHGSPMIIVRISDNGPGIAREELERIFEPFHRSPERPEGGSGLGLAIARGFLEANGGSIRAESLPGQGASFVIMLPVPAEQTAAAS